MTRWKPASLVACGLFATGCIVPYRAHPTFDFTPAVKLPDDGADVRAFRVDITRSTHHVNLFEPTAKEWLTEIPLAREARIGPQYKAGSDFGLVIIGGALNYVTRSSDSLALRIYRPGYETVEIRSWQRVDELVWVPAPTRESEEAALDRLLPPGQAREPKSAAHAKALAFVAGEYQRLLAAAHDSESRKRLEEKATNLRRLLEAKQPIPSSRTPEAARQEFPRIRAIKDFTVADEQLPES
jgi:hypothetical protein